MEKDELQAQIERESLLLTGFLTVRKRDRHLSAEERRNMTITNTNAEGEVVRFPPMSTAVAKLIRGGAALGLPVEFVEWSVRCHETWCDRSRSNLFAAAISGTRPPQRMNADIYRRLADETSAPLIARNAFRHAVKLWHHRYYRLFRWTAFVLAAAAGPEWWMRIISVLTLVVLTAVVTLVRLERPMRQRSGSRFHFLLVDYTRIVGYALVGASIALVPPAWTWGASFGLACFFFERAAWFLFSEACAVYGARGHFRTTLSELPGVISASLLKSFHDLDVHDDRVNAAAMIYQAGRYSEQLILTSEVSRPDSALRTATETLAVAVRSAMNRRAEAVLKGNRKGSTEELSKFVGLGVVAAATGKWEAIAIQGSRKGIATYTRPPKRLLRLLVRLVPAMIAVAVYLSNLHLSPLLVFATIVLITAVVDFLKPSKYLDEAIGATADAAQISGL